MANKGDIKALLGFGVKGESRSGRREESTVSNAADREDEDNRERTAGFLNVMITGNLDEDSFSVMAIMGV